MDLQTVSKERLAKRIAGEIVLSENGGKVIQKWRNIFKLSQRMLANKIGIMPSVISDYENGRRKSPGIRVIKKIVNSMIELEEESGGRIIKEFSDFPSKAILSDAVIDIKEFDSPVDVKKFCKELDANIIVPGDGKPLYGYTLIDSQKAILEISPSELVKLYGLTSERALVFTRARTGRSSMVALKVTNLNPGLVVFQTSKNLDPLAKRIAEQEGIAVAITKIEKPEKLTKILKDAFKN